MEPEITAIVAFVISIISATATIVGLAWQIALYKLSAARLAVKLSPCVMEANGGVLRGPPRGWGKREPDFVLRSSPYGIDFAEITVTNIGRMPVSVEKVELDVGRARGWRLSRRSFAGIPVPVDDKASLEGSFRLESGQSARVYYEIWGIVEGASRNRRSGRIKIHAVVTAAGMKRQRSPMGKRWKLDRDSPSLRRHIRVGPYHRAYRVLWSAYRHDADKLAHVISVWNPIRLNLRDGADVDQIAKTLEFLFEGDQRLVARDIRRAFQGEQGFVGAGPGIPRR